MYDDDTPVYDILFEMQVTLCQSFPAFTPLTLRREKAREVFMLLTRYSRYLRRQKRNTTKSGKKIIRRPASDTWF